MLSIVLYGRNDNYGYNLHKRAALSLNCMAEVLTAPDDEILFVDYNTPDDFPTFPEAIRDTLTPRAQRLLRILRVRPAQHARFQQRTHLKALEPISRNVALRRSNPANRWILSTNTDMIFVPRRARSLSQVAGDLDGGFYHLPRFEIPEYLWETLDRTDPDGVIAEVGRWGWSLHLNEVVTGLPTNRFDGPGDFQMALREDLFAMHGFDERMLIGWHVDSNLAVRMALLYGRPDTILDDMFGYHCDHTRQVTPAHSHNRVENDWRIYVSGISRVDIPSQADAWGLAGEDIEEIQLARGTRLYLHALHQAVGAPMQALTTLSYLGRDYDRVSYDSRHVLPFLLDAFTAHPAGITLAWFGARTDLLQRFAIAWQNMGQVGQILVSQAADWLPADLPACCRRQAGAAMLEAADILLFDFGFSPLPADGEGPADGEIRADRSAIPRILRGVELAFRSAVEAEHRRIAQGLAPRRLIAVNAINNRFGTLVESNIAATQAPLATRLRQGFVLPPKTDVDLIAKLFPGEDAGEEQPDGGIATRGAAAGVLLHGFYRDLPAGRYRVTLSVSLGDMAPADDAARPLLLQVFGGRYWLAALPLSVADLRRGEVSCLFTLPDLPSLCAVLQPIQLVVMTDGSCAVTVRGARVTNAGRTAAQAAGICEPLTGEVGWLAMLRPGPAVRAQPQGWLVDAGPSRCAASGPYAPLLPGRYAVQFALAADADAPGEPPDGETADDGFTAEVFVPATGVALAQRRFRPRPAADGVTLEFEIAGTEMGLAEPTKVEFRLFTDGRQGGRLHDVRSRRLDDLASHPALQKAAEF